MDLVMKLPQTMWKTFTLFINMAKSLKLLISPSSKSISDNELFYTSQNSSSPEVIEKIGKAVAEGDLQKVVCIVKDEMQSKSRYTVKIAVTGDSGNGMSSFINALRLIGHEEEDSAPTGVVRTTQKPACYSSSHFPDVELWDLPGLGATAQSVESYLDELQISTYDLIIIIASEQFSANHVKLAKAMQRMRKRFYVVWTKLDRDLSTSTFPEPQLLQNIQRNIQENLQKGQVREPPLFLVSCFSPSFHDFPEVRNTLQSDFFNIRYRDPLETLSQVCDRCISNKASSLKEDQMLMKQLEAPFRPASDMADLERALETYQKFFGVNDESFLRGAQSTGRLEVGSRALQFQDLLKMDRRLRLMMCVAVKVFLGVLGSSWWFGLWNFIIQYFRHQRHKLVIEIVAENTKATLRRALKDSTLPPEIIWEGSGLPSSGIQAASGSFCLEP
ncbi:immunity-related GTPase family M protein-like [Apodemus sylvaticus]|uniref:immunity-related GTPase family M protein-like n=1 Tax=Apodemus sylvaticus TaxID=10129 RepID=UPI002241B263|nr:immunity-related GTPase family M protein-like [Apodemus sylvaticus]XP_052053599.1 immunity-related GTPase family M protein-like [Apodemus sylvaticus]XP_052053600.1 immunity-related GTPase family M protein-like [Apodemus sylvaticus]